MNYDDAIEILKSVARAINDPMSIADKLRMNEFSKTKNYLNLDEIRNNNIYADNEISEEEDTEIITSEDSEPNNDSKKSNDYDNKQKYMDSNSQGVIDSITQELTSVRLQQAIILSEIVGKPRSKTRKKRRI